MAVCKHCGTEIEEGLVYCPNCGQSIEDIAGGFFDAAEDLEEEAYNIFDAPEEFDMDSLLSREFESDFDPASQSEEEQPLFDLFASSEEEQNISELPAIEPEAVQPALPFDEQDDIAELLGLFGEESLPETEAPAAESRENAIEFPAVEETDFFALDDLFDNLDPSEVQEVSPEEDITNLGLEDLLAAGTTEKLPAGKNKKVKEESPEKQSFFQMIFGNVPVDPSKIKPEPTPEQIAAKKQKEAEEKKAKEEAKKLASEEKKQIAQRNKEEKARQKALAKEEKKTKKLAEAKLILEEMKETRINRVGATIVFVFFAVVAIVLLSGSDIFGYVISIHSAESNFNKAYNNNVKYYTDAYNDIYGLEIKPEDQLLNDKIMTVMFVNKELNSYNSHMVMSDYESALHSLLLGLYRYGKYYEQAIPLGIDRDMDYVRTQILKELEATFSVSEDEAEYLRSMLETAGPGGMKASIDEDAARLYNLKLYEIVKESGLKDDSNN